MLLLPDLESFVPELVLKRGQAGGRDPRGRRCPEWVKHTIHVSPVASNDFRVPWRGGKARVIGLIPDQIVTASLEDELTAEGGYAVADPARDLAKVAVLERHLGTGRMGLGFVRGFGIQRGAFGSTLSHDAHNVVVVGVDDDAMARAVGRLRELGGGIVVVEEQGVARRAAAPGRRAALRPAAGRGARVQPRAQLRRRRRSASASRHPSRCSPSSRCR